MALSAPDFPAPLTHAGENDVELRELASLLLSVSRKPSADAKEDIASAYSDQVSQASISTKNFEGISLQDEVQERSTSRKSPTDSAISVSTPRDVLFANCFKQSELEILISSKKTSATHAPAELLKDDSPVPHSKTFLRSQWQQLDTVTIDGCDYLVRLTAPDSSSTVSTRTKQSESSPLPSPLLSDAPLPLRIASARPKCRVIVPKECVEAWLNEACEYWTRRKVLPTSVRHLSELCAAVFWMGKGRGQLPWDSAHTYLQSSGRLESPVRSIASPPARITAATTPRMVYRCLPAPPSVSAPMPSFPAPQHTAYSMPMHPPRPLPVAIHIPHMMYNISQSYSPLMPSGYAAALSGIKRPYEGERSGPFGEPKRMCGPYEMQGMQAMYR